MQEEREPSTMAAPCRPCGEGRSPCHLRRIGTRAPVPGIVADVIHFCKTVTLIGRNREVVDYFLSSAAPSGGKYISRIHARVIWTTGTYELVDSSLTGVYVNDIRISGKVALQEGDTVTFGNPAVSRTVPGAHIRQPNSPFYFLFEHCHCNMDGERNLPPEFLASASVEVSPPFTLSLGFVNSIAVPQTAPPLTSTVSVVPPVTFSLPTNSLNVTSVLPGVLRRTRPAVLPVSAPRDRPASQLLRSTSPDYTILGERSLVTTESPPQRTLATTRSLSLLEGPEPSDSESLGGGREQDVRCRPDSPEQFLHENGKSDAGTGPAQVSHPLPAPACLGDSAAADHGDFQSGRQVNPAGLRQDLLHLAPFFQTKDEDDSDSKLSTSSTEELVPGDSDHDDETMEVDIYPSAEETAEHDVSCVSEPAVAQLQITEEMREAVSGAQVTSVGRMEKESPVEEQEQSLYPKQKSLPEGSELETDRAESMSNNPDVKMQPLLTAKLGNACHDAARRTADDTFSGEEPGSDSCTELVSQDKLDAESVSAPSPPGSLSCGMQSGGDDEYEMNSQESVSDSEGDVEAEPHTDAGLLAVDCLVSAGDAGCLEPEAGSVAGIGSGVRFAEPPCAEVGTQTECAKERELDVEMTEPADQGAINAFDYDNGLSTYAAKEMSLQQLSEASPTGFPAENHSKGEFSKQGEEDPTVSWDAQSSEDLPETHEEERALVAAVPPRDSVSMKGMIPEEPLEALIPERPVAGCLSQSSKTPVERRGEEMVEAEERREHASPGCAETDRGLENCVADSTQGPEEEMAENDGPSLGTALVLVAGLPGGEQPSSNTGRERQCQEETDNEDPTGEGEAAMKGATGEDAGDQKRLAGKGPLERELSPVAGQRTVSCLSPEVVLPRSLEGNATQSSFDLAGRKAGQRSPFPVPGDDPEEGGIPRSSDSSRAGTPLSSQASQKDVAGRLEAGSSLRWPHQGGPDEQGDRSLNGESAGAARDCGARAIPDVVEASLDEAKMDSKQNDTRVGLLNDRPEHRGPFSAHLECQQQFPVPVGQQKRESPGAEPDGLEYGLEGKPQGTDVGEASLCPEDASREGSTLEETCEPDAAAEPSTPLGPESSNKEIALPEQQGEGGGLDLTPASSHCSEEKVSLLQGTPSVVFEKPEARKRSAAGNLTRVTQTDSAEVPESCSSDELNLHISDSEAEKEENDGAGLFGASSRFLWRGRDALLLDPVMHLVGVAENNKACRELTEESTIPAPCDSVTREANTGPLKGIEMLRMGLGQQESSPGDSRGDLNDVIATAQTHSTEMAVGEKSAPFAKTAALGELQGQAVAGTELVPLDRACLPAASPCLSQSSAEIGTEEQAPERAGALAENTCLDLAQEDGLTGDGFPGTPEGRILTVPLEVGKAIKEHPESEVATSLCSGKEECAQETEAKAPGPPWQETETLLCQGDACQATAAQVSSAGFREGLGGSEYHRTPLQKEEELKGCSSRKRHFSEAEVLRISDLEDYSCSQKRPCPLDSVLAQGSASDLLTPTLPAPLGSAGRRRDQFDRTVGKFLDQRSNEVTLHLDDAEQSNRDSIAQIVRNYFKKPFCSNKPATENKKAEMLALPPEAETGKDMDCESASILETGERASCDELGSPEDRVKDVQFQDSTPDGQCLSASALSSSFGGPTQEQGKDSASDIPESVWEAYFSEEEHFQLRMCSVLKNAPSGSPVKSPDAARVPVPGEMNVDSVFSDISNSSVESDLWEPLPSQQSNIAAGPGSDDGLPTGGSDTVGKAAEVSLVSGFSREASDVDRCEKDPRTPSDVVSSPRESSQAAASSAWPASECHVTDTPDGALDGDDGEEASGEEDAEWDAPCATSTAGEKEQGDRPSQTRAEEERAFLQRSHADLPSQEMECEPAADPPSASSPWRPGSAPHAQAGAGHSDVPLERESSYEERDCQEDGGNWGGPPSVVAAEPAVGDAREGGPPPQSSPGPRPGPTQAECPVLPNPPSCAARGGSAEADGGASGRSRGKEGGPLPSSEASGPAGMADNAGPGDLGGDLEDGLCRSNSLTGLAGQTDSSSASRRAPGNTGAFGTLAAPGVCGDRTLAGSPSGSKDAASPVAWSRSADAPSVSRVFKEERDLCDRQDQLTGPSRCTAYPMACSPAIPVFPEPRVPEALTNRDPESSAGPVNFGSGDRLLLPYQFEEAEVFGRLEPECVHSDDEYVPCCAASPGFEERDPSVSRDHPDASGSQAKSSNPCPDAAGTKSNALKGWASSKQDVEFQLQACQSVLGEISQSLDMVEGIDHVHMERWRDQIAVIQKATKMPQTYIAVVGNTGAGKSCLLNALLGEEAVLPTSAMRACTAVVVEISRAAGGSPYEADVEFLSREEWYKELKALLEDLKDKAGNLKRRCPDRSTEAGAAYSRVKAVYGRVDELVKLEEMQEVTQHLGTLKHIFAETAADFRTNIERFINSRTDNLREMKGGEFWPVVKCVRIRVAEAEVLKTGAVLVDLPGVRDSNAARDKVAKEYLKDCNAVWVVASVTRAVDDKTAREMLGANLRRQLLMDGRYGSLAFICTKTDSFNITDIVRDLDLQDEIQAIEGEVAELENQKMQAEAEKRSFYEHLQQEQQRRGSDAADPAWLQRQHEVLEKEFRISALQRQKDAKLRAISLICVQARNKFSKQRISMDFRAGLEEMMRKAAYPEYEEDGDEDLEDGDLDSSDPRDLGDAESQDRKLQVFTVSSTEYLKLCGKLLRDGQPQVFHDIEDTEIPALRKFAIDTALKHSMVATQKVIRDLARVLSQMVNYLSSQRAEDNSHRAQVQEVVHRSLQDLPGLLQEAMNDSLQDIQTHFDVLLLASLRKGTAKAKEQCEAIVRTWGLPVCGYQHSTYRAVCIRHGAYTPPKSQCVDFNGSLADPILKAISLTWHEVFNTKLKDSFEGFAKAILDKLKSFFKDLKRKLSTQGRIAGAIRTIYGQQMEAARARLLNFTLDLTARIERRQRDISRELTPEIQAGMKPAYAACAQMSGPGYFRRMKETMECYIHKEKDAVFDSAAEKLQEQLDQLQQCIRVSLQSLVWELNKSLKMQFEPVLMSVQRNAKIIPELMAICAKVDKLCKRSCVEYLLPSPAQTEGSPPIAGRELQGGWDPTSFSATFLDIRFGAVPLPHVAAIQVSRQDISLTLADDTAVALPLRNVSRCESCLPLGCLILHVSPEAAEEICSRCRVQTYSSGLRNREALVILDVAQDQKRFAKLTACVSSSHRDASWFQALGLQRGRETLEALGVHCTAQLSRYDGAEGRAVPPGASVPPDLPEAVSGVQRPQFPALDLHPCGKRRAAEAIEPQPEKKHKGQAAAPGTGCDPSGYAPLCGTAEAKPVPCARDTAPCSLPTTSPASALEGCKQKATVPRGAAQHHAAVNPDVEQGALPGSGGLLRVRAKEGIWGKCPDLNAEEGSVKDEKMEIGRETRPADCSWMSH